VLGGGSPYRNGGLAKVRLLRGGSRGPAAPPSLEGKVEGQGMEDFDWQGKRKVSSRFGDLSRPWNFSLLFFLFAFSPLPPFFPFSLFLQPGNLEVRLGHVETREGLVTYGLPGRDG
jgi:hypothetical protein